MITIHFVETKPESGKMKVRSETQAQYVVSKALDAARLAEDNIIRQAISILESRIPKTDGSMFFSPDDVKSYLRLKAEKFQDQHEVFSVVFMDAKHSVIAYEEMFHGTLTQTSVYPREVVKRALAHNAAAVILSHNHPSGDAKPSRADEHITTELKRTLALVDVRVLDHIVVGSRNCASFAEMGLL